MFGIQFKLARSSLLIRPIAEQRRTTVEFARLTIRLSSTRINSPARDDAGVRSGMFRYPSGNSLTRSNPSSALSPVTYCEFPAILALWPFAPGGPLFKYIGFPGPCFIKILNALVFFVHSSSFSFVFFFFYFARIRRFVVFLYSLFVIRRTWNALWVFACY